MTDKEPTDRELAYTESNMTLLKSFGVHDLVVGDSLTAADLKGAPITSYLVINTVTGVAGYDGTDMAMAHDIAIFLEGVWDEVMNDKPIVLTPPEKKLVLH